jgi:predicted permease
MVRTFEQKVTASAYRGTPLGTASLICREYVSIIGLAFRARRDYQRTRHRPPPVKTPSSLRPKPEFLYELRHAARALRRSPGFTFPAALTLALGIAANVAIFSVVRGVVMKPLPYPEPDRIVILDHAAQGIGVESGLGLTRGLYATYAGRADLFSAAGMYETGQLTLTYQGLPERVDVASVTPSTGAVFDTPPIVGRWFNENDGAPGTEPTVLISEELWVQRFGSDKQVAGRTVTLQGVSTVVIGVMPRHFTFPDPDTQVWHPLQADFTTFGGFTHRAVARLQPGVKEADAQTQLNNVIPTLPDRFSEAWVSGIVDNAKLFALVRTLHEDTVGHVTLTLWVLLGSVSFIWLMACANVANLLLVRSEARRTETALRKALGASQMHVVMNWFIEIGMLTAFSTVAGLGLAWFSTRMLTQLGPDNIPRLEQVGIDFHVLTFCLSLAVFSTLLLGGISTSGLATLSATALRDGSNRTSATSDANRFKQIIGTGQIAVAVVLLVGSGLMIRTYQELRRVNIGFTPDSVLTFEVGLTEVDYPTGPSAAAFQRSLVQRLAGLPGVTSVGAVGRCLPFGGWCGGDPLAVQGRPAPEGEIPPIVSLRVATLGYFEAMEIPLLAGRVFQSQDANGQTNNVVISAALADAYWPGEEPLGQRVSDQGRATPDDGWYTVVGVVGNVPARSITEIDVPTIYFPTASLAGREPSPHTMRFAVRTNVPPISLVSAVRTAVIDLDDNVPLANVQTLASIVSAATATTTFVTILLGIAAAMALFLGVVGVYSVISYSVAQRRHEIGIRLALGATTQAVNRLIISHGLALAGIGIMLGVAGSFALTRYMESLLFEVTPNDPLTYGGVMLVLALSAFLASYLPARRAAGVDPVRALREG